MVNYSMRTRFLLLIMMLFFVSFGTAACSSMRIGDFTLCSTKNVALDNVDLDKLPQKTEVIGEDKKFVFLFIPFGIPRLENAVDDALAKGGGDLMVDTAVYAEQWWFLVGQTGLKVKGTVVKTRGN